MFTQAQPKSRSMSDSVSPLNPKVKIKYIQGKAPTPLWLGPLTIGSRLKIGYSRRRGGRRVKKTTVFENVCSAIPGHAWRLTSFLRGPDSM